MKRRRFEHPADVAHQDIVRGRADGPAAMPARAVPRCLPPRIDTRPRPCPHAADALHTIRPTGGDRLGATRCVDLRRAKGRPASSWSTFAYSNSVSIRSSPILACSRRWSSSTASVARLFKPGLARRQKAGRATARPAPPCCPTPATPTRDPHPAGGGAPSRVYAGPNTAPSGHARRPLPSPSGLPPPPPNSDRASSSRHSSCENFLAIKCPRKP